MCCKLITWFSRTKYHSSESYVNNPVCCQCTGEKVEFPQQSNMNKGNTFHNRQIISKGY